MKVVQVCRSLRGREREIQREWDKGRERDREIDRECEKERERVGK